ncbi:ATP-dependent DNA helicase RecQ-like [Crassostrea virginica]
MADKLSWYLQHKAQGEYQIQKRSTAVEFTLRVRHKLSETKAGHYCKRSPKNDCISILPTGYGKSLIFEILPFVDFSLYNRQCIILLICPLNVIIEGYYPAKMSRLNRQTYIVVDEAHLVPQWGEDFRPMFKNICNLKSINSDFISVLALTATASSNDKVKVVLATIALGMGADLQNVKHIIHAGPPTCPEVYVQEVGRAGRDGHAAEAVLYFNNSDLAEKPVENSMIEFFRTKSCRRQFLSTYFDAPFESVFNCCDVCNKEEPQILGFKVPSLEERHYVQLSLQAYVNADSSGELAFLMSEEKIQTIVDCFEFIRKESSLPLLLNANVPESVSSSLFSILSMFH